MIFNIQRFSTHDGEGIRTVIFYKGCPLRCQWCSNPESQSFDYSFIYDKKRCKNFRDCIVINNGAITPGKDHGVQIDRKRIQEHAGFKDICPSKALTLCGEDKNVDDILQVIEKDSPFYRESGGVTLSGGEPLSQGEELIQLLKRLKERNINVNMETSLHVEWKEVSRCIGLVDTFLVDLKHMEPDKFEFYTQGEAALVLNNLKKLVDSEAPIVIRIPVIPEFNHTESEMNQMIDYVASLGGISEIHFLPYHTFGNSKYKMLDMEYPYRDQPQVQDSELEHYKRYAALKGIETRIGG